MSVRIKSVTITPNELNVGQPFFISVNAEEIKWNDLKSEFQSWEEVRRSFDSWEKVKNYIYDSASGGEENKAIPLTITGSGNTTYCYVTINGSKYYSAGTHEVKSGDTVTIGVYGRSTYYVGTVTIDGQTVLRVTDRSTKTYEWVIPSGISTISIQMSYTSSSTTRRGVITITTS